MHWQSCVIDSTTVSNRISFYKQRRVRWLWIIHYNMLRPLTTWDGYKVAAKWWKIRKSPPHCHFSLHENCSFFPHVSPLKMSLEINHATNITSCTAGFAYLSTFLAWLNIGLCMHNIGTQWREMWSSHVSVLSLCWFSADRLSAYGTERLRMIMHVFYLSLHHLKLYFPNKLSRSMPVSV